MKKQIPVHYFPYTHGVIHGAVDASTVMVLLSAIVNHGLSPSEALFMIVSYDLLAFAGQALLGLGLDHWKMTHRVIVAGILFSALGVALMLVHPYAAMAIVGIGNALFHVGAGAASLHTRPGRATDPGIFVAPGALGLGLGMWLGKGGNTVLWPFFVALVVSLLVTWKSALPTIYDKKPPTPIPGKLPMLLICLLLFSISIRAFVGYAGSFACPKIPAVALGLSLAAFLGKGIGGFLSDRLGWIRVSVGALLLSAPLIAFGGHYWMVVVLGMLLFQMTMPVTLTAIWGLIPGRPAFAFGISCAALVLGAFASFYRPWTIYYGAPLFIGLIVLSAATIYVALAKCRPMFPMKFEKAPKETALTALQTKSQPRN